MSANRKSTSECGRFFSLTFFLTDCNFSRIPLNFQSLQCDLCATKFELRKNLLCHIREQHNRRRRIFTCPHCDKDFTRMSNLKQHASIKHSTLPMPSKNTCAKNIYISKKKEQEKQEKKGKKIHPKMPCSICSKIYSGTFNLNRHIEKEHKLLWKKIMCKRFRMSK